MIDRRTVVFGSAALPLAANDAWAAYDETAVKNGDARTFPIVIERDGERFEIEAVDGRLVSAGSIAPQEAGRLLFTNSTLPDIPLAERANFTVALAFAIQRQGHPDGSWSVFLRDGEIVQEGSMIADDGVRVFCDAFARECYA